MGLVLENVTFRRGDLVIVDDECLRIPTGGTLLVTGGNGVGKSTLLHICAGVVAPERGVIKLGGNPADPSHPSGLVRRGVRRGVVFQQGGLVANLSALHNVGLPLRYHADLLGLSDAIIDERARFCLGAVGVESPDIHALPGRLSFGIRKRVAFARAMAIEPNYAFFDDPDAGLDRENAEVVHDILTSYRDDPSITMVVATNHRVLIERLGVGMHELIGGRLHRQDLHTMPPSSLV